MPRTGLPAGRFAGLRRGRLLTRGRIPIYPVAVTSLGPGRISIGPSDPSTSLIETARLPQGHIQPDARLLDCIDRSDFRTALFCHHRRRGAAAARWIRVAEYQLLYRTGGSCCLLCAGSCIRRRGGARTCASAGRRCCCSRSLSPRRKGMGGTGFASARAHPCEWDWMQTAFYAPSRSSSAVM